GGGDGGNEDGGGVDVGGKAGNTKKVITFPSIPYMSKGGTQYTHSHVREFDEKSASLMTGEDGGGADDLPDFVVKKDGETGGDRQGDKGVLQDTGECVVCLVSKRNCIIFPCRHTNTCLSCAQLYIQNSLSETANSIPKCPVCRENIALLVHVV
ncbi:RING-HC finger protein, partial [archaeon]